MARFFAVCGVGRSLRLLFAFGVLLLLGVVGHVSSSSSFANTTSIVWFADHHSLHQIDPVSHQIIQTIPLAHEATALAVDPHDRGVWVLAHKQLLKFDENTSLLLEIDLKSLVKGVEDPEFLSLNTYDGSVWVAAKKVLLHLSNHGQLLSHSEMPEKITALALSLDESLWLLTQKQLLHLAGSGEILNSIATKTMSLDEPRHLALDAIGAVLWLADEETLIQLNSKDLTQPARTVSLPDNPEIERLALNPFTGILWLVTEKKQLLAYDRNANLIQTIDLAPLALGESEALAFEPVSQSLWFGSHKRLAHFSTTGALVATLQIDNELEALGVMPSFVLPNLTLLQPPLDALTNNPKPAIRLSLSATCNDVPCDLGPAYLTGFTFNATLNAQVIGEQFVITGNEAIFTPSQRLPEGLNTFTAQVRDIFVHVSNTVTGRFTIDTIPPTIHVDTPADGLLTRQPVQILSGHLSEPALLTVNGAILSTGPNNSFNKSLTLVEGANTFLLSAQDPAGNIGQRNLRITLDTIPPGSANAALITLSNINNGQVTLTGKANSVEPNAQVSVTNLRTQGITTTIADGTGSFITQLNVQAGDRLSLIVNDAAGNVSSGVEILIPGGVGSLPPDPATIAPEINRTVATTVFDATAFLYTGVNPIQTGVAAGTIEPKRAAVLRGKITTRDGAPLPGVKITIQNHLEFGQTLSRVDGMFDLALNGGGIFTVNYTKAGHLPVQRKVNVPWQDYAWLPDVALTPLDQQVSTIDLTGNTMQVARGSIVNDSDGARQATILFPPGITATMLLADGSTQPLNTLRVRATEYTVGPNGPKAMPAPLPANSGYTYAVDYSVDEALVLGAKKIQFSKPVMQYVENFLNFPVGMIVPVGYYDFEKAAWIPSENGRVIKILGITNGLADIDTNGDGIADDAVQLALFDITETERQQLANIYQIGTSLWRVPITHFSSWDSNWPFGPPDDAKYPEQEDAEKEEPEDDPCREKGSTIECQNQNLGEEVKIVGTPLRLHYQSDRTPGRKTANILKIPLTGTSVPASLRRIELEITIAGRMFTQSFPAATDQKHTFVWDGNDAYGRTLQGEQSAFIRIGYVYPGVYRSPEQFQKSFGYNGRGLISGNRARVEVTLWQEYHSSVGLGFFDARTQGLGGWTLNVHHAYDVSAKTLYLGTREQRRAQRVDNIITTVAGNGIPGFSGDGGPATEASIFFPSSMTVSADGSLYIVDTGNSRIRRVTPDGIITTVAGNGSDSAILDDGVPATQAALQVPSTIAVDTQGNLFICDAGSNRIRVVRSDGIIRTLAGRLEPVGLPDDPFRFPWGMTLGPDNNLYVADWELMRVIKLSPDGTLTTVAGWMQGTSLDDLRFGNNVPAANTLIFPQDVALAPDGTLYIVDSHFQLIRRISSSGIISTVAEADGGPPTDTNLYQPFGIEIAPDSSLYIADRDRVRRISPDGIISTVAGDGIAGYGGDGGSASAAHLNDVLDIAFAPDGSFYIADSRNHRIRKVAPLLPGFSALDIGISSKDGKELYQFDPNGRHLRTLNALTNAVLYQFSYDSHGYLVQIQDGNGNTTRIERDGNSSPVAIAGPDGQRTTLVLNSEGYLVSITNPANEKINAEYTSDGLMTTFTNTRGHASKMAYDNLGRLIRDENPAGGFWNFNRTEVPNGYEVNLTSSMGRTTNYRVEALPTGEKRQVKSYPDGRRTETLVGTAGSRTTVTSDGTVSKQLLGPDPRFGMQSPVVKSHSLKTPAGLIFTQEVTRSAALANPSDLLNLTSQIDSTTINGRTYIRTYDGTVKQITDTSPQGRQRISTIDTQGRKTEQKIPGLEPWKYSYDTRGRLGTITQGAGTIARTYSVTYNAQGYLDTLIDPLSRSMGYIYDNTGRIIKRILPDNRQITYTYDATGNVTSITPPGRPTHTFAYTPVNLGAEYIAPNVGTGGTGTKYSYNTDKQLTQIGRPDGQILKFAYDTGGRLSVLTQTRGDITQSYHATTGHLASIAMPDGGKVSYSYDGMLMTGETWTGTVAGTVTRAYDNNFRIMGFNVNGNSISFTYDNDNLLTRAGTLTLTREPSTGFLTATALGGATTSHGYNTFGELTQFSANQNGNGIFSTQYTRDKIGRIVQKTETITGQTDVYTYTYDHAGRLIDMAKNGLNIANYEYDANGNRLSYASPNGTIIGQYDDQDRLIQYGNISYSYTQNGELQSKTENGQTTTYDYDVLGQLLNASLPNGTTIEYVIDGRNRRIGKKVNGALAQGFLYQNSITPIAELGSAGSVTSRFVYGSKPHVPDYIVKGADTYRIISDHLVVLC